MSAGWPHKGRDGATRRVRVDVTLMGDDGCFHYSFQVNRGSEVVDMTVGDHNGRNVSWAHAKLGQNRLDPWSRARDSGVHKHCLLAPNQERVLQAPPHDGYRRHGRRAHESDRRYAMGWLPEVEADEVTAAACMPATLA